MTNNTSEGTNYINLMSRGTVCGLALAATAIVYGALLGIVFGLNEDAIKDTLKNSANIVRESVYHSDDAAIKSVLDKSWSYMKRAHLHAGAMGTTAVSLILLLSLLHAPKVLTTCSGVALGGGALGYSLFWMLAGFRAPGLGGTSAAKESLAWLAMPTSGAFALATLCVLVFVYGRIFTKQHQGRS
jgi:hypothetical protein